MALTIINYFTDGEGNILFTLKGAPKDLPKGLKGEAGDKRGTIKVGLNQQDFAQLTELGAIMKIAGEVTVEDKDAGHWSWFQTNFVPEDNGGGKKAVATPPAAEPEPEAAEAAAAEEITTDNNTEEEETVAAKKTKKSTPAKGAKKAPVAKVAKAVKAAPAKMPPKAKAAPVAKAAKMKAAPKEKAPPKPRKEKEPEPEVDTAKVESAIVALAGEAGVRYTKVLLTRIGRRLTQGRNGVKLLAQAGDIVTAGVVPGQTYTIRKNHARAGWGICEYAIEVLADSRIKLVSFKGEDHGRGLKSGQVFDTSKDLLKKVLKLPDPHVTLAKFFSI